MTDSAVLRDHFDEPVLRFARRDVTPLSVNHTVEEALAQLRGQSLVERLVYFYVVDARGCLVGVVPTRRLLMGDLDRTIGAIMDPSVESAPSTATVRAVSEQFLSTRLLALPIVDADRRLVAVADVAMFDAEISDLARRHETDVLFQMIGTRVSLSVGAWRGFANRFPWLLCNVAGGLIAALVAAHYEHLLDTVLVLALFMPVVLALSESISMQSVTLTLQHLHRGRVDWRTVMTTLGRELATASLLGAGCGAIIGAVLWLLHGQPLVALVVGVTVMLAMATAAVTGVVLPSALRSLQSDPRIASGPIVLALVDFGTLLIYFNLAGLVLS